MLTRTAGHRAFLSALPVRCLSFGAVCKATSKSGFRSNDLSARYKHLHFAASSEATAPDRTLAIDESHRAQILSECGSFFASAEAHTGGVRKLRWKLEAAENVAARGSFTSFTTLRSRCSSSQHSEGARAGYLLRQWHGFDEGVPCSRTAARRRQSDSTEVGDNAAGVCREVRLQHQYASALGAGEARTGRANARVPASD